MGSMKDYWIDQIEAKRERRIAEALGITEEELGPVDTNQLISD